jgi:hypothetical protein
MDDGTRPCAHCGSTFTPRGKPYSTAATYCAPCGFEYRRAHKAGRVDEWHAARSVRCACGNVLPVGHAKYCSPACKVDHSQRQPAERRIFSCAMHACHNLCVASQSRARFCSGACKWISKRVRLHGLHAVKTHPHWVMSQPINGPAITDWPMFGPIRPPHPRGSVPAGAIDVCQYCQVSFVRGGRTGSFCSGRCINLHSGRMATACPVEFATCQDSNCGKLFAFDPRKNHQPAGCCTIHSTRIQRRRRKRANRARKQGVAHEAYTLREIAERDGWRCHLCGGKVPDRKYSARDKDPTIDHLVPQSHGGDDVRSNVALAHNRCNWERGNQGTAQLRLVG